MFIFFWPSVQVKVDCETDRQNKRYHDYIYIYIPGIYLEIIDESLTVLTSTVPESRLCVVARRRSMYLKFVKKKNRNVQCYCNSAQLISSLSHSVLVVPNRHHWSVRRVQVPFHPRMEGGSTTTTTRRRRRMIRKKLGKKTMIVK